MKYYYLLLVFLLFSSCNLQKKISETGYSAIQFGSGGGVANNVTSYSLLPDGEIWMFNSITKDSSLVKRIPAKEVLALFQMVKKKGLDTLHYNNPDNMYHFIEVDGPDKSSKIIWGQNNVVPSEEVLELYKHLTQIIK
jgi:hypothetical protein